MGTRIGGSDTDLIRSSKFFNPDWYLDQYPAVRYINMEPAEHYLLIGYRLNYQPSQLFDGKLYLESYRDIDIAGANPLVHYERYGKHTSGRNDEDDHTASDKGTTYDLGHEGQDASDPVIIIPVFNAPSETHQCIESVIRNTPCVPVLIINDASTDPVVEQILRRYDGIPNISIITNEKNIGFTRTVNKGIALAENADVILLNSDTIVTPLWLQNLRIAAYSAKTIGTVTPFSNNAGAFSVPLIGQSNAIPSHLGLDDLARLVTRSSVRRWSRVPTGNGFCMYIKRRCIEKVGLFDEEAFPRGYGEENDFCMRARKAGWENVLDDATYIYHARNASFGETRHPLMEAGRKILDGRHPDYTKAVRAFVADGAINGIRSNIGKIIAEANKNMALPRVLFVVSTRTGGTPQTNEDLMRAIRDRYDPLLMRCDSKKIELSKFMGEGLEVIETISLDEEIRAVPHRSSDYDDGVRGILVKHAIELVHIRHLGWHSVGLTELCKSLKIPVVFSFHDFYMVCPTVNLLDENKVYCKGICTNTPGDCSSPLWPKQDWSRLKGDAVFKWQEMMLKALSCCDAFVTTSLSAKAQILDVFPQLNSRPFTVLPHGRDIEMSCSRAAKRPGEVLRILVPGNINETKGARLIEAIAREDRGRRFEFHILGWTTLSSPQEGIVFHGRYKRDEFSRLVKKIAPHIGVVLTLCPETFCHTLTEMWALEIPVLSFDFGAVSDRIRMSGGGWLLESTDKDVVLNKLIELGDASFDIQERASEIRNWQSTIGRNHTTQWMSNQYDDLYRRYICRGQNDGGRTPRVALVTPSRGNASTQVRVLEKYRSKIARPIHYDWMPVEAMLVKDTLREFDAVIVQRTAIAPVNVGAFVDQCRLSDVKIIYEIDDDLTEVPGAIDDGAEYEKFRRSVITLLSEASMVITSTHELKMRLSRYSGKIVVSPNKLSERLWFSPLVEPSLGGLPKLDNINILYMGSYTHGRDLALLEKVMERVSQSIPNVKLFIVGVSKERSKWYEAVEVPNSRKQYETFVPWFRALASMMDIAVAPLEDTRFNDAKSGLKYMEYAAAKIPGVYSDVVPYREVVIDGKTGLLTDNSVASWSDKIVALAGSRDLRRRIVDDALADVCSRHCLSQEEARIDERIMSLVRDSPRSSLKDVWAVNA